MSKQISLLTSALVMALYAVPGLTHDPEEHEAESVSPDCAAIENIDASKVDSNDLVTLAILQKCEDTVHDDGDQVGDQVDDDEHDHDEHEHSEDDSDHDSSSHSDTHASR